MKTLSRLIAFSTLCFGFLLLGAASEYYDAKWKVDLAKGNMRYHKVKMSDYKVVKFISDGTDMRTWGFIHYSYQYHWHKNGNLVTAKITDLSIRSGLEGAKSLRREGFSDTGLLIHEQHHLDINELFADKFRKTPVPIGYGPDENAAVSDLKEKMENNLHKILKEAQAMQDLYDKETNHSRNDTKQKIWNKKIEKLLRDSNITFAS